MGKKEGILLMITIILLFIMLVMACYNMYIQQNSNNNEFDVNETTQINEIANAENNRRLKISLDMLAENEQKQINLYYVSYTIFINTNIDKRIVNKK